MLISSLEILASTYKIEKVHLKRMVVHLECRLVHLKCLPVHLLKQFARFQHEESNYPSPATLLSHHTSF